MCVSGMRGPLYSLWRSVPAIFIHGNMPNHHQEDKISLPTKMHLDRCLSGFGRTPGSADTTLPPLATVFLWYTAWWALMLVRRCRASLVGLVWFVGLFCMCYAGNDLFRLCLRILRVFFLFRTCAPENINLRKQLWI